MARPKVHGQSNNLTYRSWRAMLNRCRNKGADQWPKYGGAGIKVCPRWLSFEAFFADMGSRPSKDHTLDRFPYQTGHYEPGNVRWATSVQQGNNKSTNRIIIYRGQEMTIAEARHLNGDVVAKSTVLDRLSRGWPVEAAIETVPIMGSNQWRKNYVEA